MNRIAEAQLNQVCPPRASAPAARPESAPPQPAALDYCLFGPLHYEPKYAYPLIIWLHGPGGDEREIERVMPHISLRNYVGIAPRGPTVQERLLNGAQTYHWRGGLEQTATALGRVLDSASVAKQQFNIAPQRIFLAGYGSGGSLALRLALTNPGVFAGAASFGGPFPRKHAPLRCLDQIRQLPLFLAYGRDADEYGQQELCEDLHLIHAAGLSRLNIRQYPSGDDLVTQMLHDFDAWVMQLVTGCETLDVETTPDRPSHWN